MQQTGSKAFQEGVAAFWNGLNIEDCPYPSKTIKAADWIRGFNSQYP